MAGFYVIQQDKQASYNLNQAILNTANQSIVTDLWWLSMNAAPIYPQKRIFILSDPNEINKWVQRATQAQIYEYTLISFAPQQINKHAILPENLEIVDSQVQGGIAIQTIQINHK